MKQTQHPRTRVVSALLILLRANANICVGANNLAVGTDSVAGGANATLIRAGAGTTAMLTDRPRQSRCQHPKRRQLGHHHVCQRRRENRQFNRRCLYHFRRQSRH